MRIAYFGCSIVYYAFRIGYCVVCIVYHALYIPRRSLRSVGVVIYALRVM